MSRSALRLNREAVDDALGHMERSKVLLHHERGLSPLPHYYEMKSIRLAWEGLIQAAHLLRQMVLADERQAAYERKSGREGSTP